MTKRMMVKNFRTISAVLSISTLLALHQCCALTTTLYLSSKGRQLLKSSLHAFKATTANEGYVEVPRSNGSTTHQIAYRVVRPMNLSSRQAAPIIALHGGPSIPSNYLYPLETIVPYRSIVFHDQLGCGKSDEPKDPSLYSIRDSVQDLKILLKKLGVRRFHLYGQSYGGILAFEYMKSIAEDEKSDVECLSAILSGVSLIITIICHTYLPSSILSHLYTISPGAN